MTYKAVAFDMDGTLLNKQRNILPETVAVLNKLKQQGIKVILVTGRHHSMIYPYYHQLQLNTPAICCNGSYLYDFNKQVYFDANPLTKLQAKKLLNLINQYQVHTLIYTDQYINYEVMDDHMLGLFEWRNTLPPEQQPEFVKVDSFEELIENATDVFKFATSSQDIPVLQTFSAAVEKQGDYECEWSWVNRADIAAKGNSKGNGLANWAKYEGIELEQIIAFGDSYNDLSMLKMAGLGIAMGNADEEIKQQADRVIGDNNSTSIAEELNRIFVE